MKTLSLLEKCLHDNIPIIREQTATFICSIINSNQYKSILEIGTAYGYSCSLWLQNWNIEKIVSLEKLKSNYEIAKSYLNDSRLQLLNIDAFEFNTQEKFDIIFIDGPKSNQEKLVEKYLNYLNPNGTMIIDNLYLKKFSELDNSLLTKNQLKLINKVNNFRNWLLNNPFNYQFDLYDIDDGVGVLRKYVKS